MLRIKLLALLAVMIFLTDQITAQESQLTPSTEKNFSNPPADCWPHTRWWWPGNPLTKKEITYELEQMSSHGIRGVEQITMDPVYEKGNIPYLSGEFMEMLKYMVQEAKRLKMEVSLNFGGPGWILGGEWVKEEDKSKDLVPTFMDFTGPFSFDGKLPDRLIKTKRSWEVYTPSLNGDEKLIAVLVGRVGKDGKIIEKSLSDLTGLVNKNQLKWEVPEGDWRLMSFWLKKNGSSNAVDHFNKGAMERYCNHLGGIFYDALGDEFGKTVESLFADSFELANLPSGLNWSTGLFESFKESKGYDLVPLLPAIWWEVDAKSPKVRYDVNDFLHQTGMKVFFETFLGWCEAHHIKGRIQAYGFNTDNIEASGKTHIPEMEITAGEKDQADWFDTRIGPKKYVSSGAHLYDKKVVSAEVYTFIHWERYRETLEELKIASDGYLLSGATKFYNHGFNFSQEKEVAPTRSLPFAAYIQPQNIWWKYYPKLAEYIARCSYLLRQGDFSADIALYSPLANQWAINCINPRKWTREFEWGELGNLIVSNGYDYDLINDDILQNKALVDSGNIKVNNLKYKLLIIPNVETIPLKTMEFIEKYVRTGGSVLFLERLPERSAGLTNAAENDLKVQNLVRSMFGAEKQSIAVSGNPYGIREPKNGNILNGYDYGKGKVYRLNNVIDRQIWWNKQSSYLDPFLKILHKKIAPDFGIDFMHEGMRKNEGLTFLHRKVGKSDLYFISNIQDKTSLVPVTFRVQNQMIRKWDPFNGSITPVCLYEEVKDGIKVPLTIKPYESLFLEFSPGEPEIQVAKTDFQGISLQSRSGLKAETSVNGEFQTTVIKNRKSTVLTSTFTDIPAPLLISGAWKMELEGKNFTPVKKSLNYLSSWMDDPLTRNFSGTGSYTISFELPQGWIREDQRIYLDLGKVGNIAEVQVNGENAGIVWMRGQKTEVTKFLKHGSNTLKILVTNTLINRISAMKEPPKMADSLIPVFGSKDKQTDLPREFGFSPLPASGLMGPVKLEVVREVELN